MDIGHFQRDGQRKREEHPFAWDPPQLEEQGVAARVHVIDIPISFFFFNFLPLVAVKVFFSFGKKKKK